MTKYSNEEIVGAFLDHIRYLTIAHHVKGRIRVKATWSGAQKLADVDEKEIEAIVAAIPGIRNYRVNKKALSVIIEYDTEILSYQLWEDVGALGENPINNNRVREELLAILDRQDGEG